MPLHAYDPVGVARPFDSFNHSIRSVGHDAKISARLEHRLVMRAIHPRAISAGHLRETGTGVQIYVVMWFGTFVTGPFMLDFRVNFAGNILDQRTTEEDVQTLHAVADCEDWLVFGDGVIEKREIGALAGSDGSTSAGLPVRTTASSVSARFCNSSGVRPSEISTGSAPVDCTARRYFS